MTLFHLVHSTMPMDSGGRGIKAMHKIKMILRRQRLLAFDNNQLVPENSILQSGERFFIDVVKIYTLDYRAELPYYWSFRYMLSSF